MFIQILLTGNKTPNNSTDTNFLFSDKYHIREIPARKSCDLTIFKFLAKNDFLKLPLDLSFFPTNLELHP